MDQSEANTGFQHTICSICSNSECEGLQRLFKKFVLNFCAWQENCKKVMECFNVQPSDVYKEIMRCLLLVANFAGITDNAIINRYNTAGP